jgi:hypothetical protein
MKRIGIEGNESYALDGFRHLLNIHKPAAIMDPLRSLFFSILLTGAVGAFVPAQAGQLSNQGSDQNSALTWMDSQLSSHQYVAIHAERRDPGEKTWQSITHTYQPSKTMVNRDKKQIYHRKDDMADYYGELFTYDDKYVYLHAETFPKIPSEPRGTWDARPNRFRLMANITSRNLKTTTIPSSLSYAQRASLLDKISNGMSADYSIGRVIMPIRIDQYFDHYQLFNTYVCGANGADGFQQAKTKSCPQFQEHFFDMSVTAKVVDNFDVVYDGEAQNWSADNDFRMFDKALIIDQQMTANTSNVMNENKWSRERFIFGYKNRKYYGMIRWDDSKRSNGEWVVVQRAVGLKILSSPEFGFSGMFYRGQKDPSLN